MPIGNRLTPISRLTLEEKLIRCREMRDEAHTATVNWLEDAQQAYKFKAGDQWSDFEKYALEAQGREPFVWNYIHPTVELITGVLTQNPAKVKASPVDRQDGFLCEVVDKIIEWVEDNQTDTEMNTAEAFEDAVVTGKGFVNIDFMPSPDNPTEIEVIESAIPVHQIKVDPASRRPDLRDARYVIYEKWVTLEDFKIRYPKVRNAELEDLFESNDILSSTHGSQQQTYGWLNEPSDRDYTSDVQIDYFDRSKNAVLLCQMEYFENYKRFFWINPVNKEDSIEINEDHAKELPDDQVKSVNAKRVKWIHFTYNKILWEGESPVYRDGFSILPMFAYTDKSTKQYTYYGIVKNMIDPQRECNRRWMQAMRLMARQGIGVMAEADAFLDIDQAEDSWSDPDQITFLEKGALKENKVQEKTRIDFPAASIQMEEISRDAMKQISGVNPDMLGIPGTREEPGIVVKMRRQQGLTIISKLFRNYRRMLKALYKRKLHIITKYMPDWQIMRILGENDRFSIKNGHVIDKENNVSAPIRAIRDLKYNIRIEDAPGNMDKMMSELSIFMDMMKQKFPVDPEAVIDRLDIDETTKIRWKKYIGEKQDQKKKITQMKMKFEQQQAQIEMQEKMAKLQLENQKIRGDLALKTQELRLKAYDTDADNQRADRELQRKTQEDKMDYQVELAKLDQERQEAQLEHKRHLADKQMKVSEEDRKYKKDLAEMEQKARDRELQRKEKKAALAIQRQKQEKENGDKTSSDASTG